MDISRIITFFHCSECRRQLPYNETMQKWTRFNVGMTSTGIEVWCVRHRMLVVHITPDELRGLLQQPLHCECCPGGRHVVPSHQNN